MAVNLISALVGAIEVPGSTSSWPARTLGYPGRENTDPGSLKWTVFKGLDGFLQSERFGPGSGRMNKNMPFHGQWPIKMPEQRHQNDLDDIIPIGLKGFTYIVGGSDREEVWKKLGATYKPEMLFTGRNPILAVGDNEAIANALKEIPFIVAVEIFNTETTEGFADIVLPDACFLEKDSWNLGLMQNFNHAWGMDDWCYHISQKVVEPMYQRRSSDDINHEIAERLGKELGRDLIAESNTRYIRSVPINEEYRPDPSGRLTAAEIGDAVVKSMFGPEHDWEWFKEHGYIRWPKRVEEAYWMWYSDVRVPVIYMEFLAHMKPEIEKINKDTGLFLDPEQYTPLISWFACTTHKVKDPKYDLYCFSYRDILHSGSQTMEQPWIDEASLMNPWTYNITINTATGKGKGLKDGDTVEVETYMGRKETGIVKLMEGHHPLTVGIAACSGHWAKGMPIARGKGTNFDNLLPMTFEHMDPVCANIEIAVRVSVKKIDK